MKDKECFYCKRLMECKEKDHTPCLHFQVRDGKEKDYKEWLENESKRNIPFKQ